LGQLAHLLKDSGKEAREREREREIRLAQRIVLERRMKWPETDISFGPKDHPEIELFNRNLPFMVKL
jgi:hypothetical protein